jgi:hypothetical protein
LWISHCEIYIDMYEVEYDAWIKVASMHCKGPAARWLQSVEKRAHNLPWSEFSALLLDRFGHDQRELFIRQMFQIKQTGTVSEYVDRFTELVDQLIAYDYVADYTIRFVDGLRDDIRGTVLVQRLSSSTLLVPLRVAGRSGRTRASSRL